jgi:uncharacterized membrane protein
LAYLNWATNSVPLEREQRSQITSDRGPTRHLPKRVTLVVSIGGAIYLVRHGQSPVDFRVFRGESADLRDVRGIIGETMGLHGRGIIQSGLLLLIATAVARVAFSIFGFAQERDRMYVVFTVIVFSILLFSLLGSA